MIAMQYARKLKKGDRVAIVSLSSGMLGEEFCSHNIEIGVKNDEDTYLYTIDVYAMIYSFGGARAHFSIGVAAGMFKSLVAIILLLGANGIARALDEETLI